MKWAWRIGKVAGIDVKIHVTLLGLLVWVGWSQYVLDRSWAAALGAVAFVSLVFAIIVLHELGHALTARHFGVRTRDITLLPIGGVAALERMPEDPRQEFLVAVAGPAVNVGLALLLAAGHWMAGMPVAPSDLTTPGASWLTQLLWLNVALALFNLLPAFPMDGGRALRALLALRLGNLRATQLAATLGQGMALLLGLVGLFANPLLMFIALFVWLGASGEAKMAQIQSALEGIAVEDVMVRNVAMVYPHDTLQVPLDWALQGFQQDFPVVEGTRVVGMLCREDLIRGLSTYGPAAPVAGVMRRDFKVARAHDMVESTLASLQAGDGRCMPVVDRHGQLLGLVTIDNIGELILVRSAMQRRANEAAGVPWLHAHGPAVLPR